MSDSRVEPGMREALRRHTLTEVVHTPGRTGKVEDGVRFFRLAEPGTRMMSVDLIFAAGRIWISGDFQITEGRGVVSDPGYDLAWFTRGLGESYLAEKFLRKRHVPALALEEVREDAARYFADRLVDGEEPDEEMRQERAALDEAAAQGEDGPCGSAQELFELYSDLGVDTADGVPGWGYDPRELGWLSAIQQRFAELYDDGSVGDAPGDPSRCGEVLPPVCACGDHLAGKCPAEVLEEVKGCVCGGPMCDGQHLECE